MSKRIGIGWTLSLTLVLSGLLFGDDASMGATKQVLTARHAKQAPAGLDDPVWRKMEAVEIVFDGKEKFAGKKAVVTAKAVYTDDGIHFLFTWADHTHSVAKGAWEFDGQHWRHLKGDEDRLALLFEVTRINQFATKGCTVTCHVVPNTPVKDGKFGTKTEAEKGDLWHWKAARSAPYGHADDGWLTVATGDKSGRINDAGKGGDARNETKDKSKPLYMQNPAQPPSASGFLLMEEAVEIKDYSVFKAGDVLTYRLPQKPDGSRFDVKAVSRYDGSGWILMLSRKLNTDNGDDVVFNPKKEYNFAMALFDDSGDENSYDSEVITLRFRR